MPQITVRVPGTPSEWHDERINALVGHSTSLGGAVYPIVGGRRDKKGAVLIVDTGKDGPTLPAGTVTDLGPVES